MLKISVISRVRSTSKIADFFNTSDEIVLTYADFIFFPRLGEKLNFFPSHFSIILLGSARLVGIILGL